MNIFIIAACFAVVALAAVLAGYSFGVSRGQGDAVPAAALLLEDNVPIPATIPIEIIEPPAPAGSIAVPGFERLTVRGRMLDAEHIHNPARNNNYFVVSLKLADGTEIYRSGVLAPGQTVGIVELPNAITPGTYEGAVAQYNAFSLDNLTPLNGAEIAFVLEVLP